MSPAERTHRGCPHCCTPMVQESGTGTWYCPDPNCAMHWGKAPPQRTDWQPIETAPRDGTMILIGRWDRGLATIYSDHWAEDPGCWCDSSGSFLPTHWMPLPHPPECVDAK